MEDITHWYYNLPEGTAWKEKLEQIMESYMNIENSL